MKNENFYFLRQIGYFGTDDLEGFLFHLYFGADFKIYIFVQTTITVLHLEIDTKHSAKLDYPCSSLLCGNLGFLYQLLKNDCHKHRVPFFCANEILIYIRRIKHNLENILVGQLALLFVLDQIQENDILLIHHMCTTYY